MLTPSNIILFELDFDAKFPLLRLLIFLSDLKRTIFILYTQKSSKSHTATYTVKTALYKFELSIFNKDDL